MSEEIVLSIPEVQLHKVEGQQESLLEWGPLTVHLKNGKPSEVQVQVGKITWDLETTMPTLQANAHTFMFAMPGTQCFYSVLLASSTPVETAQLFSSILGECTSYQIAGTLTNDGSSTITEEITESLLKDENIIRKPQPEMGGAASVDSADSSPEREQPDGRTTSARRISLGAEKIKGAIGVGAVYASEKIAQAGQKMQERVRPNEQPMKIDPRTQALLKKCRQVAHSVNHLSGTVTGQVADMSIRVADGIVRRMGGSNYGQKLQSDAKPTRTSAAKEIAAASVVAAAEIYESMYAGAMTVMKSGGSTTADFVGHKYGPDARQAAGDVSTAAIESSAAYYNMTRMGVRTVAKRIAKRTAKGLVKNTVLTGIGYGTQAQQGQAAAKTFNSEMAGSAQSGPQRAPAPGGSGHAAPQAAQAAGRPGF
eukprot:jgi/Astpho2/7958/Aster-06555